MDRKFKLFLLAAAFFYLVTRLVNLTLLPVFADEAIYIRWAQLMNQDLGRWVFFPLQDGKPPLFMVVVAGFLRIFSDPLVASRLTSVLFGLGALFLLGWLTKLIEGGRAAQVATMSLVLLSPFTLFHSRMGLIDTMLVFWLSLSLIGFVKLSTSSDWKWWLLGGGGLGLALWAKTPAIFFVPLTGLLYASTTVNNSASWRLRLIRFAGAGILGMGLFLLLKFSPSFPALFSRSEDFTFAVSDVLSGQWDHIVGNLERVLRWLGLYATVPVLGLVGVAIFEKNDTKSVHPGWFVGFGLVFSLPFIVLGKVIAARYFLPMVIFLYPVAGLMAERLYENGRYAFLSVMAAVFVAQSVWFGWPLLTNPADTPFPREDRVQYLTEWSAGYGIPQVRDFIRQKAQSEQVVVATEGYFGTLPDGLLMYFDGSALIENIEIFGIGQPVREIPDEVQVKAEIIDTYLVVNEHRFLANPNCCDLIEIYERPLDGPALLLMKVRADENS